MAPALVANAELNLGPQYLIQQHYADAREEWERIQAQKAQYAEAAASVRTSGPQGRIEPFTVVEDPAAWTTAELKGTDDWIYNLTAQDLAEVKTALQLVSRLDVRQEGNLLFVQEKVATKEDFPLPSLGPKLQKIRNEVIHGRGFFLIRGLPVEEYTREETVFVYWGFGLWWGAVVSQNAKAHIVGHVKDIGHSVNRPITRVYATPLSQPWHNDSADMVGLLCLKQAKEGGLSSWASSISVHNEMLKHGRRDLVEEFAKPQWWMDRKGEIPPGKKDTFQLRVFHYHKGYLSINFSGTFYELAQRHSDVPRLTEKQKEALRFFSALASSDKLRMDYLLQPGDIQLLNNLNQQHQRSSYQDAEEVDERRHLLRLWLTHPDCRPLPDEYAEFWGTTEPGRRGGILVDCNTQMTVPLEAE